MFGTGQTQNQNLDQDQDQEMDQDMSKIDQEGPTTLDESRWSGFNITELDDSRGFTYGRFSVSSSL